MQEKLNSLKEISILEISNWWGLHNPGSSGTIITQDKKIYHYTIYHHEKNILEENNIPLESISKGKNLTEEEYERVIKFIEDKIVDKTFTFKKVFDAGWNVRGHYNGQAFNIHNDKGFGENEKGLYDITKEFLNTIKGES